MRRSRRSKNFCLKASGISLGIQGLYAFLASVVQGLVGIRNLRHVFSGLKVVALQGLQIYNLATTESNLLVKVP